jgi:hypothetical protein
MFLKGKENYNIEIYINKRVVLLSPARLIYNKFTERKSFQSTTKAINGLENDRPED